MSSSVNIYKEGQAPKSEPKQPLSNVSYDPLATVRLPSSQ